MLVAYFDETYTKDTRHCVFALVMPADSAAYVEDGLNEVLEKSAQSFEGLSPSIELHGYELASGEGSWAHMKKQVRARIGIYRQALEVIANTPGAVLCSGQVNLSTRLVNDPHQWALTFALEKVNQIAQELDVVPSDVVNALRGSKPADSSMGSMEIVVMKPETVSCGPGFIRLIWTRVGPFLNEGPVEALDFAVSLRSVRAREPMLDP